MTLFVILFKTVLKTNFICKILLAALPNTRVLVLIIQGKQRDLERVTSKNETRLKNQKPKTKIKTISYV